MSLVILTACAVHVKKYSICVEQSRKIMNNYQFNDEPLRLLVASLSAGLRPTDSFITSTLQKAMLREVKLRDTAVTKPETLKWMPVTKRYSVLAQSKDEEEDDEADGIGDGDGDNSNSKAELPKKHNPVVVAIYGQICMAAKSYQSAICKCCLKFCVQYLEY